MTALTEREEQILAFARAEWRYVGAKETAIRELFGCSAHVYYLELNGLLDRPEALAGHPALVNRLRRLRDERKARRTRPAAAQ